MHDAFLEIHRDLPREGPGDSESTARALSLLTELPPGATILDVGCGPGMQTLDLLRLTEGSVVAVDNHSPFLDRLLASATRSGLADRLHVVKGDMAVLPLPAGRFDLIWAEGSAYVIGFETALRSWRPLLKESGFLALTELTWLTGDAPAEPRAFFAEEYPPMRDVSSNLAATRLAGYEPIANFTLPEAAWWRHYYDPMEDRLRALRDRFRGDPEALEVLARHEREIAIYRDYSAFYGYVFYVLRYRAAA